MLLLLSAFLGLSVRSNEPKDRTRARQPRDPAIAAVVIVFFA
jgi:hypothetical protein